MSDRLALIIGLVIVALVIADVFFAGASNLTFLARKGMEFIEWLAFWR